MTVDRSPARLSGVLSVVAAGIAAVAAGSPVGTALASLGTVGVLAGVARGRRDAVTAGAAGAFGGVLVGGLGAAPPEATLVGTVAAVWAWDVGEHAVGVGEQLGRAATTRRGELVHAAAATLVGVLAAGSGYLVFRLAAGGQPVAALVALVAAAIALAATLS